jgi:orotidine-5'-phosphate decarboxylase
MSGLMNIVSRFTRGARTTTGRGRPAMHPGMGTRANAGGAGTHGRTAAGGGALESMARRVLRRGR